MSRSPRFLEDSEWWNEHLVNDVQDAVVCNNVCLNDLPTIDLDAFPYRGGHRVCADIVKRVSIGIDLLFPQWDLRDGRPHSEPLPFEGSEEEAVEQIIRCIIPRHDVILEYLRQFARVGEQISLLVIGQAVKSGIGGNEDGE